MAVFKVCAKCGGQADLGYGNDKKGIPIQPLCYGCLQTHYPDAWEFLPEAEEVHQRITGKRKTQA